MLKRVHNGAQINGVPDLMTGANQQNEGWGYILYLNEDKTVKTYTRINNTDGGFGFTLVPEDRFSRSISFLGDLRGDGTIAVNYGGGAGAGSAGALYLLFFKPCEFNQQAGLNHWSGGNTLFTNWDHTAQMLTSDPLTFEQCTFKAFETNAPYLTYNFNGGRCICKDATATLTVSTEFSTAFTNECNSFITTDTNDPITGNQVVVVFPNPTSSDVVLEINDASFTENGSITLFSLIGHQLYSSEINSPQTKINLSSYPKGIYILVATVNGASKTFKILKE
jgi:hypothetical protein